MKYKNWLNLREATGDYIIHCNWKLRAGEYDADLSKQDEASILAAGIKNQQLLPIAWIGNINEQIYFHHSQRHGWGSYLLSPNKPTVKQVIIPNAPSSTAMPPSSGTSPVNPIDFFTKTVNNMTDDKFIKTLEELMKKHRNKTISTEEWQILKRLRYALTKIEIGPEHLPEWRKYV